MIQSRRDDVEHGGVHVSVYVEVSGSNEDRISLGHSDIYQVYR
jgi:hypothetical protein